MVSFLFEQALCLGLLFYFMGREIAMPEADSFVVLWRDNEAENPKWCYPKDDFAFVYEKNGNNFLHEKLFDAERYLISDPKVAVTNFRVAFESIGIYEKAWEQKYFWGKAKPVTPPLTKKELEDAKEANSANSTKVSRESRPDGFTRMPPSQEPLCIFTAYKFLVSRFLYRQQRSFFEAKYDFPKELLPYASQSVLDRIQTEVRLLDLPFLLYSILSELGPHLGKSDAIPEQEIVLAKLCARQMLSLCRMLFLEETPTEALAHSALQNMPIDRYLLVPGNPFFNLVLPDKEQLYAEAEHGYARRFFLVRAGMSKSNPYALHDKDAIRSLPELTTRFPESCPVYAETIGSGKEAMGVFSLSGTPFPLTQKELSYLTDRQRIDAAGSLIRTVYGMHSANPPFAHRSLRPEILLLCRHGKPKSRVYRIVIANFDSSKFYAEDTAKLNATTYGYVRTVAKESEERQYLAPECKDPDSIDDMHKIEYACRADIYSLGKVLSLVLPDSVKKPGSDFSLLIESMCQEDPKKRPDISAVKEMFDAYAYPPKLIRSHCLCRGERENLEDTIFTSEEQLHKEERTYMQELSSSSYFFGVTDGIGGSVDGRKAAIETASLLSEHLKNTFPIDAKALPSDEELQKVAEETDAGVSRMLKESGIRKGGAAFAAVLIQNEQLVSLNVGDCKVYLLQRSGCRVLSIDDCSCLRKNELTQYAGMQRLMPGLCLQAHITRADLSIGDLVLICSDGVSETVSENGLREMYKTSGGSPERMEELLYSSLSSHTTDNAAAILVGLKRVE